MVSLCLKIVMNPYFDGVIMLVIILNTIFQSFDRYPELGSDLLQFFHWANYVFTFLFSAEVLLKMVGLGIRSYFVEKFNQFDFIVVVISIIEIEFDKSLDEKKKRKRRKVNNGDMKTSSVLPLLLMALTPVVAMGVAAVVRAVLRAAAPPLWSVIASLCLSNPMKQPKMLKPR